MVEVDVVVPAYGEPFVVQDCLERIKEHSSLPIRLIVGNDGAGGEMTDCVRSWIQDNQKVKAVLFSNPSRRYFTRTCNAGSTYGTAPVIVFIHPYVGVADKGWLEKILQVIRQDARARCATIVEPGHKWNQNPPYSVTPSHHPMQRGLTAFRRIKRFRNYWPESHPHDSLFLVQKQVFSQGEHFWVMPNLRTVTLSPDPEDLIDRMQVTQLDEAVREELVLSR